jgi:hypothetical protein
MPQKLQSLLLTAPSNTESTGLYVRPKASEVHESPDDLPGLPFVRNAGKGG